MKQDLAEAAVFITNGVKTFLENGLPLGPIRLYYGQVDEDLVSIANEALPAILAEELNVSDPEPVLKKFLSLKARDKFYTSVAARLFILYMNNIKITFGQAAKRVEDYYIDWKQKSQN